MTEPALERLRLQGYCVLRGVIPSDEVTTFAGASSWRCGITAPSTIRARSATARG